MTIPALQSGIAGIHTGLDNLRRDAGTIAQAVDSRTKHPTDVATSLVNLKLDRLQVEASAKVVETVHDLLGRFLDVEA